MALASQTLTLVFLLMAVFQRDTQWKADEKWQAVTWENFFPFPSGLQIIPSMCTHEKDSAIRNWMRLPNPASTLNCSFWRVLSVMLGFRANQARKHFAECVKTVLIISSCTFSSTTKISFILSMGKVLIFLADWKPNKYLWHLAWLCFLLDLPSILQMSRSGIYMLGSAWYFEGVELTSFAQNVLVM